MTDRDSFRRRTGAVNHHRRLFGAGNDDRRQKGAMSVEFALLTPLILAMVLAVVHFGGVVLTRHRVTDAANFAVRAAV